MTEHPQFRDQPGRPEQPSQPAPQEQPSQPAPQEQASEPAPQQQPPQRDALTPQALAPEAAQPDAATAKEVEPGATAFGFTGTYWWAVVGWVLFLVIATLVLSAVWGAIPELAIALAIAFAGMARVMLGGGGEKWSYARGLVGIPVALMAISGCLMFRTVTTDLTAEAVTFEVVDRETARCELAEVGGSRHLEGVGCDLGGANHTTPDVGDHLDYYVDGWLQDEPELVSRFERNDTWVVPVWGIGIVAGLGLRFLKQYTRTLERRATPPQAASPAQ